MTNCSKCGNEKVRAKGLCSRCYHQVWAKNNPKKIKASNKRWRKRNPEKVKEHKHKYYIKYKNTIVKQLIEKKDMMTYIDYRIKHLKLTKKDEILKQSLENREYIKQKFEGTINELENLKIIVQGEKIKEQSKIYYEKLNDEGD